MASYRSCPAGDSQSVDIAFNVAAQLLGQVIQGPRDSSAVRQERL